MIAKIWNFSGWIKSTDTQELKQKFNNLLKRAGFTVLNEVEHKFEPQGYTGLWLLAESHFAIHTFPEQGYTYIELSSCSGFKQKMFLKMLKKDTAIYEQIDNESSRL
ncbi:S-adenosylmethionine decarboxylase [Croceibacter phage P2559S]|uniref:S-adenosylmethionine decarboxylase n=1 Tax=Croceibacter phage P2559S TaxID=1176422 RepID=UPI0002688F29|nr:S-adenosylmethionine decarboxylase [Croceibacter phage P2559S]AFM54845.1 S-adenosylmethionine decarboxylase [Croceibacter phage P2559S]